MHLLVNGDEEEGEERRSKLKVVKNHFLDSMCAAIRGKKEKRTSWFFKHFRSYLEKRQMPGTVHDAGTFPVVGYTVDYLENFVGFDRRVCILLCSGSVYSTEEHGCSIANPRYRAFVASRGISRVIFVTNSMLRRSIAECFQMDKPPSVSYI